MGVDPSTSVSLHTGAPAECRELTARILASQTLRRSVRLRELLQYLADATFDGDAARLKEPAIGKAVYGRPEGYNTNDDNVVRMGVSQLRRKLAEYFASEGKDETLRLDVPRGQYALHYQAAEQVESPAIEQSLPASAAAQPVAPEALVRGNAWRQPWVRWGAIAIALVMICSVAVWATRPSSPHPVDTVFWQEVIGDGRNSVFVSEDVDFLAAVTASQKQPSLEAYADRENGALLKSGLVKPSPVTATTQLSLRIATQLAAHQPERFGRVRFVPAGEVRMQDFKETNVILVGSPRACPWLALFEESLNFQFEHDPVRHVSGFRNRRPRSGEASAFLATPSNEAGGKVYSTVALLPNLTRTGHILILMGTRTEGTAAAAEAVTTPRILKAILSSVGYTGSGPLPYFEALLEARVMGNATAEPQILTSRLYSPDQPTLTASGN